MIGLTEEQLAMRLTGISASEIAGLLGLSSWMNPCKLYRTKVEGYREPENPYMKRGRYLERAALDWYADERKVDLSYPGTVRHHSRPILLATPDAVANGLVVVEAKTVGSAALAQWGDVETDQVPRKYLVQAQYQMGVLGMEEAHIPALKCGEHLHVYVVRFDAALFELLASTAEKFWETHVAARVPPKGYRPLKTKEAA